jgi:hypothetical protein
MPASISAETPVLGLRIAFSPSAAVIFPRSSPFDPSTCFTTTSSVMCSMPGGKGVRRQMPADRGRLASGPRDGRRHAESGLGDPRDPVEFLSPCPTGRV